MIHAKTKDTNLHIEGPDDNGHYWLYLSASGETCRIDLGVPRGMVETALLMAASVKFVRSKDDYTLAAPLQRIVEGAKTAPKWDTQADRIAALPARGVGVPTDPRPANCRFRLKDEGKPHGRSSCSACGRSVFTGLGNSCHLAALAPTDAAQAREAALREAAAKATEHMNMHNGSDMNSYRATLGVREAILALLSEDRT